MAANHNQGEIYKIFYLHEQDFFFFANFLPYLMIFQRSAQIFPADSITEN